VSSVFLKGHSDRCHRRDAAACTVVIAAIFASISQFPPPNGVRIIDGHGKLLISRGSVTCPCTSRACRSKKAESRDPAAALILHVGSGPFRCAPPEITFHHAQRQVDPGR